MQNDKWRLNSILKKMEGEKTRQAMCCDKYTCWKLDQISSNTALKLVRKNIIKNRVDLPAMHLASAI